MEENKRISDLFERARTEAPKTSFEEVKKHVIAASAVGGVGILAKWTALSFKLKSIIMIATLSTLTISTILIVSQLTPSPKSVGGNTDRSQKGGGEIVEIRSEDGIQSTIVYNEKNEVLEVSIDSSTEVISYAERIKLKINEPESLDNFKDAEKSPIVMLPSVNDNANLSDSLTMRQYKISEKTSREEIEKIQKLAIAAGLEFNYSAKIRNNKIKRLTINMKKSDKKWMSKISGSKSFNFNFGWWEDSDGHFVKFLCNKDLTL